MRSMKYSSLNTPKRMYSMLLTSKGRKPKKHREGCYFLVGSLLEKMWKYNKEYLWVNKVKHTHCGLQFSLNPQGEMRTDGQGEYFD